MSLFRNHSLNAFTFRGVKISLHISLIFLLFYVFMVALLQLPFMVKLSGVDPSQVSGPPLLWAFIFSLGLLFSIFLHESGHIWMARRLGAKVHGITFMMVGGVAHIGMLPEKPYAELKVSVVGPVVSFLLSGLLFFIHAQTSSPNLSVISYWLANTNMVLGIFNLLPAFPTDGGRILRSLLIEKRGKLEGTKAAVRVSRGFAAAFAILGLLQFNVLLILIALFIYVTANSEMVMVAGQTLLKGKKVRDVGRLINPVPGTMNLYEVADQMARSHSLVLPLEADHSNYAVVSSELLKSYPREQWPDLLLSSVKCEVASPVKLEDLIEDIIVAAFSSPAGALPIVENKKVIGIISVADIVEALEFESLTRKPVIRKSIFRPASGSV